MTETIECPLSERVDGKRHSWKFDGDDPYVICFYCDEVRDALTGAVIRAGRGSDKASANPASNPASTVPS